MCGGPDNLDCCYPGNCQHLHNEGDWGVGCPNQAECGSRYCSQHDRTPEVALPDACNAGLQLEMSFVGASEASSQMGCTKDYNHEVLHDDPTHEMAFSYVVPDPFNRSRRRVVAGVIRWRSEEQEATVTWPETTLAP